MPNLSWDDWDSGPEDYRPFEYSQPSSPAPSGPGALSPAEQTYANQTAAREAYYNTNPLQMPTFSTSQQSGLDSILQRTTPIAPSPAPQAAPQQPQPAGGDPRSLWNSWYQSAGQKPRQSMNTSLQPFVDYLKSQGLNAEVNVDPHGFGKGINLNGQFIKLLDGYDNPIWEDYANAGQGGGAQTQDPSSELYINELLARMGVLRQPVQDPLAPLYQLMALTRVQNLAGDPYTGKDDAALTARYMNPLTQARDAELQANKERIGARGMLPTSGLLDELNKGTNQNYQQGVAIGSNDLAVRAVDERQRRQDEQLSVLADLLRQGQGARREEDLRGQELIDLAAMLPAHDERRMQLLLDASNDGGAAANAGNVLLSQQANAIAERYRQAQTDAQRDAIMGEFFGSLLDNWDEWF